jgi:DNA polymerase-1
MIKLAMIKLIKHSDRFEYKLTMQVHDELLFEVREKDADAFRKHVIKMMEDASPLSVPVVVDAHIGDNWDETH